MLIRSSRYLFIVSLCINVFEAYSFQGIFRYWSRGSYAVTSHQETRDRFFARYSQPSEEEIDYDSEETLLKLHFSINDGIEDEIAIQKISRYCQSFPFAAVLLVQPLQYLPTDDGGVDVRFLRKKTKEKGSIDGGIRFFVTKERDGIDVIAKRNSNGQSISKMFSEKMVVQSFVKRISGEEVDPTTPPPTDILKLSSVFHKWMS